MLESTQKRCPICNVTLTRERGPKQAVKDHCHKTGIKRAVICHRCNVGLGMFRESIDILVSAVIYLRLYRDVEETLSRRKLLGESKEYRAEEAIQGAARILAVDKAKLLSALSVVT